MPLTKHALGSVRLFLPELTYIPETQVVQVMTGARKYPLIAVEK